MDIIKVRDINGYVTGGIQDGEIKDTHGYTLGHASDGEIKDIHGYTLGRVSGDEITDVHGYTIGHISGGEVKDIHGYTVGRVDDGASNEEMGAAGFMLLGLGERKDEPEQPSVPSPSNSSVPSGSGENSGCLVSAVRFIVAFFLGLSLSGKIGAIAGLVLAIVTSFSGEGSNIILFIPFFTLLGGGIGTLAGFIISKLSESEKKEK
jgi:hypothetical protein